MHAASAPPHSLPHLSAFLPQDFSQGCFFQGSPEAQLGWEDAVTVPEKTLKRWGTRVAKRSSIQHWEDISEVHMLHGSSKGPQRR